MLRGGHKVLKLVEGGGPSVINGAYPIQFFFKDLLNNMADALISKLVLDFFSNIFSLFFVIFLKIFLNIFSQDWAGRESSGQIA